MLEFIKHVLAGQNQFTSGGLLLMIIGGIGVYLRALPERVWWWLRGQTTMTISVKDDDAVFHWVKEWFLEQGFLKRIRRVDLDTTLRGEHRIDSGSRPSLVLVLEEAVLGMVFSQRGDQGLDTQAHGVAHFLHHREGYDLFETICG
jgi:BCS1-like protein